VGRITLICTAHSESGKCNEHELSKILLAVGPEVIFEEIRPADFESSYADKSKYNIEMQAIKEYLKSRKAQQVPVDDYEISDGFGPYMRALDEFVESMSGAYHDAMDEIFRNKSELGFSYLNSSAFVSRIKESERLYQETVSKYGNDLAKSKLSEWNDQIRKRDASMLGNIYKFCQRIEFIEGVFLVGAAHISSIMDGIERYMKDQPTLVTWRFWNSSKIKSE
jgi:hypothetical protein